MKTIYLDHHATTPCDASVFDAMSAHFVEEFGNPNSVQHDPGLQAAIAVDRARAQVANLIGASSDEIVFTSGATESNSIAIRGLIGAAKGKPHIITSNIEHPSVRETIRVLERKGVDVTWVPVDAFGLVNPADVEQAIHENTVLVSIMFANNEIGTVQPIRQIGRICREHGVFFHTDAAQAVGHIPIDVRDLGVDMLSLSAHKMYGPKGAGALYLRKGRPRIRIEPLMSGGGQERGIRPGTLPVPQLVGLGAAADLAAESIGNGEEARVVELRELLIDRLFEIDGITVNGSMESRLPHNLSIRVAGTDAARILALVPELALSSGSACASEKATPSYVLEAIELDKDQTRSTIRIGLGRGTTREQIETAASQLATAIATLRGDRSMSSCTA